MSQVYFYAYLASFADCLLGLIHNARDKARFLKEDIRACLLQSLSKRHCIFHRTNVD
jgi:hypothetical protein